MDNVSEGDHARNSTTFGDLRFMKLSSLALRLVRWEPPAADLFRARSESGAMPHDEMKRRAMAVWRWIDGATDAPKRETQAKASRLYYVGRDIQAARSLGAQLHVIHDVVKFLMAVIARSYGLGAAR
jgi:hypothetical protein